MAYLDPIFPEAAPLSAIRPPAARRLGALDRRVIEASRRDGPASLVAARGIRRIAIRMFGLRGVNPLADPALEALRGYAVLLRHGGDELAADAAAALIDHGYGIDQVAHARWLVAREMPTALTPVMMPAMLLAAMLSFAIWFGLATSHETDDAAIGLVVALFMIVSCAPLAVRRSRTGVRYA